MVIIAMITGNWYYKAQMGTTLPELRLSIFKKYSSATMVNRLKVLIIDSYGDLYAFYDINSGNLVANRYVEYG